MKALLINKDLYIETIESEEPIKVEDNGNLRKKWDIWKRKNLKVSTLMTLCLTLGQVNTYEGIDSVKDMWETLKRHEGQQELRLFELNRELGKLQIGGKST
ncbi:hypothetical protein CHUAL_010774 [Chamberlinius hualienensis]